MRAHYGKANLYLLTTWKGHNAVSYSLSLPNIDREIEFEELHDRVRETMDAVGLKEEDAAPGVRERILTSVDHAMQLVDVLDLVGNKVQINVSGHVNQGELDLVSDSVNIGVGMSTTNRLEAVQ
jgi:hypothetical protein